MAVKVKSNSRMRFYDLITIDGFEFWDLPELPEVPIQLDDQYHQVMDGDRIDLLAHRFYGDPVLWWVIAVANDIELVPTDLSVGDILRIPSPNYVNQILFKKAVF